MRKSKYSPKYYAKNLLKAYSFFIIRRTYTQNQQQHKSELWRDRFFTQIIKFAIPIGILSLAINFIFETLHGDFNTAMLDVIVFVTIIIVLLSKYISINTKKFFGVIITLLFSILKIITLQSLMFGTIFLLLLSVFVTLLFPQRVVYVLIFINAGLCFSFGLKLLPGLNLEHFYWIDGSLKNKWFIYCSYFIFSNLIIVLIIQYIVTGFQETIRKTEALRQKLKLEVIEKSKKERLLKEAVTHYKSMFFLNPLPMLIYDPKSLNFIQINQSAIDHYGYTKDEFLQLKAHKILACEEETFRKSVASNYVRKIDQHYRKDGKLIQVDVNASNIKLNESWARLVIVRDITAETDYIETIEQKNKALNEIAYLQSHVIRSPLAKIIGLTELIKAEHEDQMGLSQMLTYLCQSSQELDDVIRNIVSYTEKEMKESNTLRL